MDLAKVAVLAPAGVAMSVVEIEMMAVVALAAVVAELTTTGSSAAKR